MTPESPNLEENYWAALPSDDFCREAYRRFSVPVGGPMGTIQQIQLAARQAFFGALPLNWWQGPSSAFVGTTGDQGNILTLRVNNLRSHALAQHQIVTAPELSWQAQAVNSDSKSMASAQRGSRILEYLWKNSGDGEKVLAAVLGGIIDGEEFIFAPWEDMAGDQRGFDGQQVAYAGDIITHNVASWDVRRDGSAKSYDESGWYSVRLYVNKWDLIARHPDRKADILALGSQVSAQGPDVWGPVLQTKDRDRVPVDYFFHKRTPAVPTGRQAVMLGPELWLEDGALEECYHEVLPLHRQAAGDLKGTPWPYSSLWEAMGIQELADDVQGSLATNIVTFGKQLISAEAGDNLPMDQIANGPQILYRAKGSQPPVPLMLASSPPEAFQHLERLRADIRQMFGLNDIVMGQPNTAQMNAQAFALIASMAITQNSDLQKRFVKTATSLGRSKLRIFRAKASTPRKVAIVGQHGPLNAIQESFTGQDFSELDDVYVEVADPLSQTAAGRLQISQLYIDRGFVQTPEQLQNVVATGRIEPLTQGLQAELIYIAEENEALLKGEEQAVKITDSHQMHIREHRATTFSAQARANPQVNIVSDQHIREHLDMLLNTDPRILAAMGQAAPAPAMPPAGPGGPPGPGAPGAGGPDPAAGAQEALAGPLDEQPGLEDVSPPPPIQGPPTPEPGAPPPPGVMQ